VLTYSALTGTGMDALWQKILDHRTAMNASGEFAARRREQQVKWMWSMLEQRMLARLRADASTRAKVRKIEAMWRMAASRLPLRPNRSWSYSDGRQTPHPRDGLRP